MAPAVALQRDRHPARAGVWLLPPVLAGAAALAAVLLAPAGARAPVAGCGAVAVLGLAAMAGEMARRGRAIAALQRRLDHGMAETERLADEVLPATLGKVRRDTLALEVMPPPIPPESTPDPQLTVVHRRLLHHAVDAIQEREYQRDSAKRAIVNIACRIQAEVHRLQDDVSRMQFRHGSPDILGDLMHLEHGINVTGRVATSLAVLGGGRPVRQWQKPVTLYDVLRAGSGPIAEYLRVEQHRVVEVSVVGPAVEPLILVLAELLDNGTRYSPPSSSVVMNTEEVASGIEISIEDKGTGLTHEARKRAEFLLTQAIDGLDLEDLGETARIGLRVAGILGERLGLRISLRPSTCDGVRAVVFVPHELLTPTPLPDYVHDIPYHDPAPAARPGPIRPLEFDDPADEAPVEYERNANGLPQRRRRVAGGPAPGVVARARRAAAGPTRASGAPAPAAPGRTAGGSGTSRAGGPSSPAGTSSPGQPARRRREPGLWVGDFFNPPTDDRDGADQAPGGPPDGRSADRETSGDGPAEGRPDRGARRPGSQA